jgi:RHS repeat-associated protein
LVDRQTTITNPLGQITTTSYDSEGNVTSTKDSLNNITRYLYDNNNRQIQVIDAKGGITKTSYDAVGNVSTITDSVNNITTYGYDAVDRLITDTNQLNKTRTRSYDNVGNLTQTVDRNGRKVSYNYDTLNRQTAERWLDGSNATIKTFSSSYDAVGHLLSSTNPDSSYSYSYDLVDRITSIDNTGTVGVPAVKFNYSYDAVGNLIAVNDSINGTNAAITGYTYDLLNRVTRLNQSGTGVQTKRVDMAYNAVNQLTSLSRYSGTNSVVDTNYVYDNNQRLIKLAHQKGANTIASYDYSYDAADKLASTVSSVDGTSNYSYDATNQLTGTDNTSQADEAYSYDANGNRTYGGYVTGVNNQLLSDGTYNYLYDGEGNRTKRTEISTGKVTEYVWDYRNRLASVLFKDAGGVVTKTISYTYDANNQRIGKNVDGAVERYVIDRNQIALVFDGAGVQTHRYLYGTQVDQVLADETLALTNPALSGAEVWFLADNQGTVKDVVDNNGTVIDHINYDSFGKVQSQSNAGYDLRFGYTGREQDGETGLNYYRARYYDSANGRFISEDPIGFDAGDSNLSRYVANNAVNATDPSGLVTFVLAGKANDLGDLPRNILNTPGRRYGVISLLNPELSILERIFSRNDINAQVDSAESLVSIFSVLGNGLVNLGKDEPIILVAHSNANLALQPIINVLRNTQLLSKGFGNTCPVEKPRKLEINVMQLDGLGVPRPKNANKVVTVGSNNPSGEGSEGKDKLIDYSNAKFYRADIRALAGVSHNGLLNDIEVLRRAQAFARFKF